MALKSRTSTKFGFLVESLLPTEPLYLPLYRYPLLFLVSLEGSSAYDDSEQLKQELFMDSKREHPPWQSEFDPEESISSLR